MKTRWKVALMLVAAACFAVALSYPIRYSIEQKANDEGMAQLAAIREAGRRKGEESTAAPEEAAEETSSASNATVDVTDDVTEGTAGTTSGMSEGMSDVSSSESEETEGMPSGMSDETNGTASSRSEETPGAPTSKSEATPGATSSKLEGTPSATFGISEGTPGVPSTEASVGAAECAEATLPPGAEATPSPEPTIAPSPTPDRRLRTNKALPYPEMEKVVFDEADILPEFQELYEINPDLVGWITIPGTVIDYPVVQTTDSEFYLKHDFYGEKNSNGQIILDAKCDPYTPSYNLVVSGHNMKSGSMFGSLVNYMYESYWKKHKTLQMDVLTEHREYVVFAAFFSADYDVDEEGFRYNVDIQYQLDMRKWLEEIRANQLYETDIDVAFGDEFLTLTTCNRWQRKDGRFVLVCRRIREGEEIE